MYIHSGKKTGCTSISITKGFTPFPVKIGRDSLKVTDR